MSHRGVIIFTVFWSLIVLIPLVGLVAWSMLPTKGFKVVFDPTFQAYIQLFDSGRWAVTVRTLKMASIVTFIELVIAFPFALWLAKGTKSAAIRSLTLALLTVPFFLSISTRTIIWRAVLGQHGLINSLLIWLGILDQPLTWLLFSEFSVILGLIGPYFPTMVFPIFLVITMIDDGLLEASRDLGAGWSFTLWNVTLPLSIPGILAGIVFTFVPMLGDNVVSTLLGGGHVQLLGGSVESLLEVLNYSVAAAMSVFVLVTMLILLMLLVRIMPRAGGLGEIFEGLKQ